MKNWFLKDVKSEKIGGVLYASALAQARLPFFFAEYGVPDTVDGRFDLVILHVYLFMRRLNKLAQSELSTDESSQASSIAQSLFDNMFYDMDRSLREMGVSDISISKRIKQMVRAFYGRVSAYDEGLDGLEPILKNALERNLFGTVKPTQGQLEVMAEYFRYQADHLAKSIDKDTSEGNLQFAPWKRKIVDP